MTVRALPAGVDVQPGGGAHARVWAPRRRRVEVVLEDARRSVALERGADGYFAGLVPEARAGTRYRFRLDGESALYPDPVSRFQPEGPHGPSQVIDPGAFAWTDHNWRGVQLAGAIIYELHIGTFTAAGTWKAAAEQLPELAEFGITILEVMPVAEF